ncbi:MAG TPA: hypothetical protein VNH11_08405 [Pirellulales bacterium]|nr:hypothetical protein [Pirellulales bacterium]
MNSKTFRILLTGAVAAAALLAVPAESHAIFEWLTGCCGGKKTPTYGAAPVYAAAAPADPCCAPPQVQTVNYVPQTCYRTQYVSVPVTTYRPATGRDPCTGCPVTCMRPMTTIVQQARLVPYTTYRMVLSSPCGGATAPATAASYAPAYNVGSGYAPPAAACCGGSSAAPMTYAPAAASPYYGSASPSGAIDSSTIIRSSNGAASTAPSGDSGNPTFKQPASGLNSQKPIPSPEKDPADNGSDSDADSGKGAVLSPRLFQPNDRTTSYPILRVNRYRPISYREPLLQAPAGPQRPLGADGWRPTTR